MMMAFCFTRLFCVVATGLAFHGVVHAQEKLPACEPAKVVQKYPSQAGKVVKIGVDPQTPPYVMRDGTDFGKLTGFTVDLATAVLDCAGIKYEFFPGAWSGMLPALNAGQIDLFWDDVMYTPERAKQVNFVLYMQGAPGALVHASDRKKYTSFDSLCGTTVAVGVGTVEEAMVREQDGKCKAAKKPAITMLSYTNLAAGQRMVETRRVAAIFYDISGVDSLAKEHPRKFARGFKLPSDLVIGAAVSKNNPDLQRAVYDGLRIMQENGKQKAIFEKYGMDPGLQVKAEIKTQ
jgi:polar amino acid transport system substrate-binding protein